ncbi:MULTISPECIES: cytochrome c oxidase accessory protein CcoG [unclassified Neptuniibacter]|uniref:cytochrome c oxidase accessory protein CcoG n=1 Tax=unclassified Neptuniibacter TaxID=2630693 RepID=UPI000C58CC19|nr:MULTISPECIES: cytochrome c oxidase accessory protein CcoG [unclassified Neptuniibacter]MAY41317.1 cytochrome c oxidase accessory protein CcoG [Oceanospirillaceae bacterium]|tara:strand:+ start:15087 stop:16511 length:1425 start_codon:yes stop_codon:yes gene_type:complete
MSQIPVQDITPKKKKDSEENFDLYAKREHIYVKNYSGIFKKFRQASSFIMLVMFFGFSWITWDGRQAVLFDLPNRQFHVFNMTFWPQDFMLLSWLLIILAFALFFFTVFAGRLWCGYACPQFVWTWIYIWIESVTEGDRNKRMRMDKTAGMSKEKILRKSAKHFLWVVFSAASAIAFVGYFTPIRDLLAAVGSFELGPWEMWWIGFITVATYGNAGWLREQVCIYMCPYARFQSVMFDQDTLIISYDEKRGESRGKRKKNSDYKAAGLGDCIDCNACVHVCPVGIDIRDGLQYECVACGACVDACDDMMERVGYEKGLVRYTTEHQLDGHETHIVRPRLIGYFAVMCAMFIAFGYTLYSRIPLEVDILRDRGQLYIETSNGSIENIYTLKIANKEQVDHQFSIKASGLDGMVYKGKEIVTIKSGELLDLPIRISIKTKYLSSANNTILFEVEALDNPSISIKEENRFIGPSPKR